MPFFTRGESVRTIKSYFSSQFFDLAEQYAPWLYIRLQVDGLEQPCQQAERRHGALQGTCGSSQDGSTPDLVTVMRHFDAVLSGSLNDIGSVFNFNLKVVQFNECHDVLIMQRVKRDRTLSNRFEKMRCNSNLIF